MSHRYRASRPAVDDMRSFRASGAQRWSERDDGFYDDGPSSSRSRDQRYTSPPRRRSPPHVMSRTLSRGPPTDDRSDHRNQQEWNLRERPHGQEYGHRDLSFSPERGRGVYKDRDREGYRSPSFNSRSRSRSQGRRQSSRDRRPRRFAAPPNKEIMMEGLAIDMTEDDITSELKQHYQVEGLTDVRVIRDRQSKQSRQFGFLRFSAIPDAQEFMERNEPLLYLYGNPDLNRDAPTKVRIVYSRERVGANNDGGDGDWTCKVCTVTNFPTRVRCFRCQAYRTDTSGRAAPRATNNGDNDATPDNTPSQFLLLRGLEPSVSEELLVKGVGKLYKPSAADHTGQQATKRGAKVASTTGDVNLGAKEGTLRRVLLVRDRRTNESWRFGFAEFSTVVDAMAALRRYNSFEKFTIASKPVLVSYVHSGVFVPVSNPSGSIDPRFTFSLLGNPSTKIAYWDEEAFVAETKVSDEEPESLPINVKKDDSLNMGANSKEVSKSKKRKAESATVDKSTVKKAAPSHVQRWSLQHAELHGLEPKQVGDKPRDRSINSDARGSSEKSPAPPAQSYADPSKYCCYLCSRQFTSAAEVNKHERLSDLHQKNLQSEDLIAKAQAKLQKHGIAVQPPPLAAEYRDRAKERRKAFGVVNKKGQQVQPSKSSSNKQDSTLPQDKEKDNPATGPTAGKGAALLSKMGYVAGAGLGASGTGATAPITQDMYVAGVGLGAEGGKVGNAAQEAERNTKGDYGEFLAKTREGARERYERLN